MHEPFTVLERTWKREAGAVSKVWYVRYRDPKTGVRGVARSLDKLNEQLGDRSGKRITSKAKAIRIAQIALDRGLILFGEEAEQAKAVRKVRTQPKEKAIYFLDYCKACWDFDTSDYIRRKNKEKANSIGRKHAGDMLRCITNYVEPHVSKRLRLVDFDPSIATGIKDKMLDSGYSSSSINHMLQSIRTPLDEAYVHGLIPTNLKDRLRNITATYKDKGILSAEEIDSVLRYLDGKSPKGTFDRCDYLMVATAIYTGMRQGEIRALMAEDIKVVDDELAIIRVSHSYNDEDGLKCTKGKYEREVTVPTPLVQELLAYSRLNPKGFIFFSATKPEVPQCPQFINKKLYKAMEAIGISAKERRERNISFHSLRHYYVTTMSEYLSADEVMSMTGHKSLAMHEHYNHETESKLRRKSEQREKAMPFNFG